MKSKQTAVEWLEQRLQSEPFLTVEDFNQAKQMEKEQIETAYQAGDGDAYNLEETKLFAKEYYNETYAK